MNYSFNKFFFSYKSNNVSIVRPIAERLKAEGLSVWMDEYGVSNKDQNRFQKKINDAIDNSTWGVIFVNDLYAESPYCNIEVERLLRRQTKENIVVLLLSNSEIFEELYPELYNKGVYVGESIQNIYDILIKEKLLVKKSDFNKPNIITGLHTWYSRDVGFNFDNSIWKLNYDSLFFQIFGQEFINVNNEYRTQYTEFTANVNNHDIKLILDYDYYSNISESLMQRISNKDIREENCEQDDRKRLKEEINAFDDEVRNAYIRAINPIEFYKGNITIEQTEIPKYECIGIHLYSMQDRGIKFKHRLFSFRIPENNLIFRVYKIVLPHPQLAYPKYKIPITIRFIFCFNNDIKIFFRSIPWCDHLVNSFQWTSTIPLTDMEL